MNITLEQAEKAIAVAKQAAQERDELTALAVVDTGGNLVAFARMDGAYLISIDTAMGKAYTALALNMDTIDLNPFIQPGQILFGTGLTLQQSRSLVPYAGGILLRCKGEVIGALGVSGARTSQTDHEIALAALAEHGQR
jgi:uncharacterized protein GlcG (DUF336 family)